MTLDFHVEEFQAWASLMLKKPVKFEPDTSSRDRYISHDMDLIAWHHTCWVKSAKLFDELAVAANAMPYLMNHNPENVCWVERISEKCDWTIAVQDTVAHEFLRRYGVKHGIVQESGSAQLYRMLSSLAKYLARS